MARNENENLSGLNIPDTDDIATVFIGKSGVLCDQKDSVAKYCTIQNKENNRSVINYYIKYGRGMLFDPYGMDMNKINSYNFQYKKVDESIYNKYLEYLKSRREVFLTQAQREFVNKGY